MKPFVVLLGACLLVAGLVSAQLPALPPEGLVILDAGKSPRQVPFFFSAEADTELVASAEGIAHTSTVKVRVLQGKAERILLELGGDAVVKAVTGDPIASWAVQEQPGEGGPRRTLEVVPKPEVQASPPNEIVFQVTAESRAAALPADLRPALLGAGQAAGFSARIRLRSEGGTEAVPTEARGLLPAADENGVKQYLSYGTPALAVRVAPAGGAAPTELADVRLSATIDPGQKVAAFELTATAVANRLDAVLPVLRGSAALTSLPDDASLSVRLVENGAVTALAFRAAGRFAVRLAFEAPVVPNGPWQGLQFALPGGTVVPVTVRGLGDGVEFDPQAAVYPQKDGDAWTGYLPATGQCDLRWRATRAAAKGKLFLNSNATVDVAVTSGLVRQVTALELRALQGELAALDLALDGPGEILAVEGKDVAGWSVVDAGGGKRSLAVKLGRPLDGPGSISVTSQSPLGAPPSRMRPLRVTPTNGEVRHSGFLRVAGYGAVRVEAAGPQGLMQLAPEQWPGAPANDARQVFVFRFPTAEYGFEIAVDQIVPEVSVDQVIVQELGETDRILFADINLDIREAPLREWELLVPADYALAAVEGADIADSVLGGDAGAGQRRLKVLFTQPVQGRRLISLRLERNDPAKAGPWDLPVLSFPGARAVRGFLAVAATPGFRLTPAAHEGLAETPLSYFPKQRPGLQHAFRLREGAWKARLDVEAVGQNIQADLFHLYTLREGMVVGSVLVNFFTMGSPAGEWKFAMPEEAGNLAVDGQGVRTWRREGGTIVVSLDRASLGASTLLLTFEQPMNARGGKLVPGLVQPLGVQGERGFVQVVSPFQVRQSVAKASPNLLKLEASELPAELRLLTSAPSLAVFQYNERPFELEMQIEWFDPAETASQIVDFARLSSTVAWDGQVVTEARWFVKTRGRGSLRLKLPAGAKLWEARAAGELVNAREDAGTTLIPLPPHAGTVTPVEVNLRYGQPATSRSSARLSAPTAEVPTLMGEWEVKADRGRVLVPSGGNAIAPPRLLAETGFEWFAGWRPWLLLALVLACACAAFVLEKRSRKVLFLVAAVLAVGLCVAAAAMALVGQPRPPGTIRFVSPVVPAGEAVTVAVRNVAVWQAYVSWAGVLLGIAGLVVGLAPGLLAKRVRMAAPALAMLGWVVAAAGLLLQRGGAGWFFLALALVLFARWVGPALRSWKPTAPAVAAATALVLLALVPRLDAAPALEAVTQDWWVGNGRLTATAVLDIDAQAGQAIEILRAPAALTSFEGDGLRVTKTGPAEAPVYLAVTSKAGRLRTTLKFGMAVAEGTATLALPTAPAAVQRLKVAFAKPGWEAAADRTIRATPRTDLPAGQSGTDLVLQPGSANITLQPQTRDPAAEETRFFTETANLILPAPGIVNGRHRVTVRPAQGRVGALKLSVPAGFTVGDVVGEGVSDWRFDPATRTLAVEFAPPQTNPFAFLVGTQMAAGQLPYDATVGPLRVEGSAGEIGTTALAFAGDAQPDKSQPKAMTPIDAGDFDPQLLQQVKQPPPVVLHQVFRHGTEPSSLALSVLPVQPEVKVTTSQVLSLGEERMVLAVDLEAEITRAGIFKLAFALPPGLEIEAASGDVMTHWTEAKEGSERIITLHLAGRTMGRQKIVLQLAGPFPGSNENWTVPRLVLRDAPRQSGTITIVPERGIRARAVSRQNVSQAAAPEGKGARPGAIAFRLLQPDWTLVLAIERLEPWVTAQALQEATVRDGQVRTRIGLRLRVENAAIRTVRLRLPGLSAEDGRSVRAAGDAVADLAAVPGQEGLWEIRFQRGVLGEVPVDIQYQQRTAADLAKWPVPVARVENARQATTFVALRASGRLELDAPVLPRGWQRADWPAVPATLQDPTDRSAPALCFRAIEPEVPLDVVLRRHSMADVLKLRIETARLTTVLSTSGDAVTTVDLDVRVTEKASLRMTLPGESSLLALTVHGQSAAIARENNSLLFHILPGPDPDVAVPVRFAYSMRGHRRLAAKLAAPGFDVPAEAVEWSVILPDGHKLVSYEGSLVLREEGFFGYGGFGLEDYLGSVTRNQQSQVAAGSKKLEEGNRYLAEGKAQQARAAFSQALANGALDESSNEDARVAQRNLDTNNAVFGLNTRRQRLTLDNAYTGGGAVNDQVAQAARENPLLQGQQEFDQRQMDQLLQGNTSEEISALKRLADRIVNQQAAANPALSNLEIALPERGTALNFTRSVQVDGDAPLVLDLKMAPLRKASFLPSIVLLALVAALAAVVRPKAKA